MEEYAVKHCDSINKSECSSGVASLTEYSSDTTVANRENLERHSPLSIFREFSNYFEEKLHEIDQIHVPNTTELKFPIYVEWVKQLREQNDDLIKTITELEHTACNRLELLQEKYKNDKNKIDKQKNDIMNLLEVIRRAREEHKWNVDGLEFNEIGYNEIFGNRKNTMGLQEESSNVNDGIVLLNLEMKTNKRLINDLADKDCEIKRLEREIHQLNIELEHREQQMKSYYFGSDNDSLNASDLKTTRYAIRINNDEQQIMDVNLPKDFTELQQQNSKLSREIEQLKLLLTEKQKDTINKIEKAEHDKHVLVTEVAEKHDVIVKLRNEISSFEDKLQIKEKQLLFKDDIIKGFRNELKKVTKKYSRDTNNSNNDIAESITSSEQSNYPKSSATSSNVKPFVFANQQQTRNLELCQLFESRLKSKRSKSIYTKSFKLNDSKI